MEHKDVRNTRLNVIGESLWGFQASLIAPMTVFTILLRQYGAGERMIGSIGAIESGLLVLPQILGIYLFTSHRKRKHQLVIWHVFLIIPFIFLNGLILLRADNYPATLVRWALLVSFACSTIGIGIILSVWLDWLAHLFESHIRGTVMGLAFFFSALFGTGAGILSGWLLGRYPGVRTFSLLYFAAGTIATLSVLTFLMIRDPAERDPHDRKRLSAKGILQRFRTSLTNSNFRMFLIGRLLASIGFCMVPFIALHYQSSQGGSLTSGTIVSCGAALTFGMAFANLILGRLGDKHGHRIGIIVGTTFQVVTLFILLLGTGKWICLITYFCAGISMGGAFVSHTNMLFETCPHDHRLAHITIGNMVLSLPLIAAPLTAGFVAEMWGNPTLFKICLCFSIAAVVWMILLVKEPRHLDL